MTDKCLYKLVVRLQREVINANIGGNTMRYSSHREQTTNDQSAGEENVTGPGNCKMRWGEYPPGGREGWLSAHTHTQVSQTHR